MYRSGELHREFGMRGGPYAGGRLALAKSTLPARARQRLSAALLGEGPASPIVSECPSRSSRALNVLGIATGAVGLFVLGGWGFGILGDVWAIQPRSAVWAYGALLALLVSSVHKLARSVRTEGLVPLPDGRYLLPYDLVEIEGESVTIHPFGDARQVRVDQASGTVRILYADGLLRVVSARSATGGPSVWSRLLSAQHDVEEATHAGAPIAADPLAELRDASGWKVAAAIRLAASAPRTRRPASASAAFAAVVALSCLAAPAALALRNRASDDATFAAAADAGGYRMYLRGGGTRHGAVVREMLLPRAALDEAEQRGDFRSLRAFLGEFPSSRFDAEARARFHEACLTELSRQSLELTRSFDARNPDCHLGAAVDERLHQVYEERYEEATERGFNSLRSYIRTVPDDPFFRDRATAKLAELYQGERHKVESAVQRAELREVLLSIAGRAQRDEIPGELYVPVTVADDLAGSTVPRKQAKRSVLAGFDAALHEVLDGALVAIYHPTNVAPADLARAHTLRIVIWPVPDDESGAVLVRYELASGTRTVAKWTRTVLQSSVPESFGADLARGAMTL